MKLRLLALCLLLTLRVAAQGPGKPDNPEDTLFGFYLDIVRIQLEEGSRARSHYPSYYYVAYVDTVYNDTLYKNLYLDEAIKFLEFKTNIYLRRGKFGGYILTKDVYNRWFEWYQQHVLKNHN